MLVQEPSAADPRPRSSPRPRSAAVLVLLTLAAVTVWILRHDYWNWNTPYPLLFGFLPVGLWWQGLVSILASVLLALIVRFAWPQALEDEALAAELHRAGAGAGSGSGDTDAPAADIDPSAPLPGSRP